MHEFDTFGSNEEQSHGSRLEVRSSKYFPRILAKISLSDVMADASISLSATYFLTGGIGAGVSFSSWEASESCAEGLGLGVGFDCCGFTRSLLVLSF